MLDQAMPARLTRLVAIASGAMLLQATAVLPAPAQEPLNGPWIGVDSAIFRLSQDSTRFTIGYWEVGGPQLRRELGVANLRDPGDDDIALRFDTRVDAVMLDQDGVLLHLQSYEIAGEGSAAAAQGRDVFLVLSLKSGSMRRLLVGPVLARGRSRGAGCWTAWDASYRVADVNSDGIQDLGVTRRELTCTPPEEGAASPPTCRVHPMQWWVSSGNSGWTRLPAYDGQLPPGAVVLPSHLAVQPVDFVLALPGQACAHRRPAGSGSSGRKATETEEPCRCSA